MAVSDQKGGQKAKWVLGVYTYIYIMFLLAYIEVPGVVISKCWEEHGNPLESFGKVYCKRLLAG